MALSPDTVVVTGNHSPVLSSSQATTAFLSAGTAPGIGSVSCTGTLELGPVRTEVVDVADDVGPTGIAGDGGAAR